VFETLPFPLLEYGEVATVFVVLRRHHCLKDDQLTIHSASCVASLVYTMHEVDAVCRGSRWFRLFWGFSLSILFVCAYLVLIRLFSVVISLL
jgi:hypothetical protein